MERLEVNSGKLVITYWLRRVSIPAAGIRGSLVADDEEVLLRHLGIVLTQRFFGGLEVTGVGAIRFIATDRCSKYALVYTTSGLPLLIGCDFAGEAVGAIRRLIANKPSSQEPSLNCRD